MHPFYGKVDFAGGFFIIYTIFSGPMQDKPPDRPANPSDGFRQGKIFRGCNKWRAKRGLRLAAPLLILPLGFLAYRPLNQWVILPWLGCGCPVMDAAGNLRAPVFCANDFTRLTALLLAAGALVFAVVNLRRLEKTRTKWLYMAGCAAWIGLLAVGFVRAQLWK